LIPATDFFGVYRRRASASFRSARAAASRRASPRIWGTVSSTEGGRGDAAFPDRLLDVDEVLPDLAAPVGPLQHRDVRGAIEGDEVFDAVVAASSRLLTKVGEQNKILALNEILKIRLGPLREILPALQRRRTASECRRG